MRLRITLTVIACAVLALTGAGRAAGAKGFQESSGNVQCGTGPGGMVCIAKRQKGVTNCTGRYVASGVIGRTGLTRLNQGCFNDKPFTASSFKTLKRGKKVKRGGVTCRAVSKGIRCVNADKHGFRLTRTDTAAF